MQGYKVCSSPVIGADSKLSFFEMNKEIDFTIKRIYYIYDLEIGQERGFHAHKSLKQVLFSPYGSVRVTLDDGIERQQVVLNSPEKLLIITGVLWREFVALTPNSVLCVGASEIYTEDDYIRDYDLFIKEKKNERSV